MKAFCAADSNMLRALNHMGEIALGALSGSRGPARGQQQQVMVQQYLGAEGTVKAYCAADSRCLKALHEMGMVALGALTQ